MNCSLLTKFLSAEDSPMLVLPTLVLRAMYRTDHLMNTRRLPKKQAASQLRLKEWAHLPLLISTRLLPSFRHELRRPLALFMITETQGLTHEVGRRRRIYMRMLMLDHCDKSSSQDPDLINQELSQKHRGILIVGEKSWLHVMEPPG